MTARYTCRHHGAEETTYGDLVHLVCGHDGSLHYACQPQPAPAGTPRPADWPVALAWRTEDAPTLADRVALTLDAAEEQL